MPLMAECLQPSYAADALVNFRALSPLKSHQHREELSEKMTKVIIDLLAKRG